MRTKLLTIVTFATFLLSSCATIIEGSRENVAFTSTPSNVKVSINGNPVGVTPFYTKLKSRKNYIVEFQKDSSTISKVYIGREMQMGYLAGNIASAHILFLSPSIVVDAITGAWFKLDKNYIHMDYEKESTVSQPDK